MQRLHLQSSEHARVLSKEREEEGEEREEREEDSRTEEDREEEESREEEGPCSRCLLI